MREELCLRKTRRYVGTCKYLDEHEMVGVLEIEASSSSPSNGEEEDACESTNTVHFVRVESDADDRTVSRALMDHFSAWDCAHEYDCCGCWSYSCQEAKKLGEGYWRVSVSSSRNF